MNAALEWATNSVACVCVPRTWDDAEIEAFTNSEQPVPSRRWILRDEDAAFRHGIPYLTRCGTFPENVHIYLDAKGSP